MSDFEFLQNQVTKKWVVFAPRRAKRPQAENGIEPICPFCPIHENSEEEVYKIVDSTGWKVKVITNKYPFAPIHEVIIHSPDHNKNFDLLSVDQIRLIIEAYKHRYNEHSHKGQVYIFHNRGEAGGESLPHPHSQLVVIPFEVVLETPKLEGALGSSIKGQVVSSKGENEREKNPLILNTKYFMLTCPRASAWPDEVWIAPKSRKKTFGEITNEEISDLAKTLAWLIRIFDLRHGNEFPFNFYIYPKDDWYLRIIPRLKTLGGFELGTNIYVNTQDPQETIEFIKEHFEKPNIEKIKKDHQAEYERRV